MYIFERKISAGLFLFSTNLGTCTSSIHLSDCKMLTAFSASRAHVHRRGCKSLERTTQRGNTVTARRIWVSDRIRNVSWVFHIDDFWRKVSLRTKSCSNIYLSVCLYRKRLNELAQGLGPYSPDYIDGKLVKSVGIQASVYFATRVSMT